MRKLHWPKKFSGVAATVLALSAVALPLSAQPLSLTLIHVNDWDRMEGRKGAGGAARIAKVVAEERARVRAAGGHAVVTFGGDMISPSLMSGIDRGAHMIALADAIGFDIGVVGNHEFDFGTETLRKRLSESRMTWLAGNVRYRGRAGLPEASATTILEKGGYRIGFLGLVTNDTPEISKPGDDVTFAPFAATGAVLAAELKKAGADLVIALTHDELPRDLELLAKANEIDILLGGHDHLLLARYDGRQAVMKAGSQGNHVAVLDLTIDRRRNRVAWTPGYRLRATAGLEGDGAVAATVAGYRKRLDRDLGAVIGESATAFVTTRVAVRSGETAFGNLLADAMRDAGGDGERHRAGQRRRHKGRCDLSRRHEADPQAGADRAALRQPDGEAPRHRRRDQGGVGKRRQPGRARVGPVSAGLRARVRVRSPEARRVAGPPGYGGRNRPWTPASPTRWRPSTSWRAAGTATPCSGRRRC